MRHTLKAALLVSSALIATPAIAQQQPTPPEHYTVDARGVDLVTGRFVHVATDVVIGDPGHGGLVHGRVFANGGWRDTLSGTISVSGSTYTVSLGAISEAFTKSGSTFTPVSNNGSTLVQSGTVLTFTTSDGTVANYSTAYSGSLSPYEANNAMVQNVKRPNGEVEVYSWNGVSVCFGDPEIGCSYWENYVRLQTVTNSYGYQINFIYGSDDIYADISGWQTRVGAVGVNRATEYCNLGDNTCAVPADRPRVTYGYTGANVTSVTDQSGRTTNYTYGVGGLTGIKQPGATDNDVTIGYSTGSQVTSLADASGSWTYAYSGSGTRTTTATGPLGQSVVAVSDETIGRATSVKDALNRTTSFQYDAQKRLKRVTQPEGDYAELTYDTRGNVTQTLYVAKAGSGLSNITTNATYLASCANPVVCNRPTSTTDARGNVTDYTYDPVHGGVLTVTRPAPTTGAARPQSRIAYATHSAQIKTSTGGIAAGPWPVALPTSVSACATGTAPSCVGTSDEVKTTWTYGSAGVANNLLPTVETSGDGSGALSATAIRTFTPNGDVESINGPLPGADDTTWYKYDNARQLIGVIGPDPDGTGALLRRAQRYAYDPRGLVTLAERGTVNGLSAGDWTAFNSLQQVATTRDGFGRATHQRVQAGGTTYSLTQTGYDAAGRVDCVATRMNPTTFVSPPSSACALASAGSYGPDRIAKLGYDTASQVTSAVSGYGSGSAITEGATYTNNGKPLTLTDGKGSASTFVYDGFDRLSRLRFPNASGGGSSTTDYEEYGYDAASNVLSFRNRAGEQTAFTYDNLNRRITRGGAADAARTYAYDNLNRIVGSAYTSGAASESWAWDALNRLTSETQQPLNKTMAYQYDLAGRRTRITWPDAVYVQYDWNTAGDQTALRENGAASGAGVLATYQYDNLGRRTAATRGNGVTSSYGYDGVSRLASLSHDLPSAASDLTLTFAHNPAAQIVSRTMSNAAYAYAPTAGTDAYVNNDKNQVTSADGVTIGYDARLNITSTPTGTYSYNGANELVGATVGGVTTNFLYGPIGRMYQAGSTRLLYSGGQAVAEYNTSGSLLRRYVPGLGLDDIVTAYEGSGTTDRRWLLADERQSVVSITNGSAVAITTNTYDEYGVPGGGNDGLFQYTGQIWLSGAKLYHYRARAYAPDFGRFLQTDPIGYAAGANIYNYVDSDPINYTDPSGTCGPPCVVLIAGGVSAGIEAYGQYRKGEKLDWGKIAVQGAIGGVGALTGLGVAAKAGTLIAPIAAEILGGAVGGGLGGAASSGVGEAMNGGSLEEIGVAAAKGGAWGFALGGLASGVTSGGQSSFSRVDKGFRPFVDWMDSTPNSVPTTVGSVAGTFGGTVIGAGYDAYGANVLGMQDVLNWNWEIIQATVTSRFCVSDWIDGKWMLGCMMQVE